MVARPGLVDARPTARLDTAQPAIVARPVVAGSRDLIERPPVRLASLDGPVTAEIPRPMPRIATRPMDHAVLGAPADAAGREWRTWMSQQRNLTRTLETVLGRDQGSLRGATNETLTSALDEVQRRYGIGTPGGPASLRDVVIARQRELVGHGLRQRDLDGMIGTRTLEADRRYTRATGQRAGNLPPTLDNHSGMQNVDPQWREWVERPDRFGRTLEVLLDREPGSLRNATPAELSTALDQAGQRYNFGRGETPNLQAAVRSVQERLHAWRSQNGEPVTIDGKVGADTEAAAAAYRAAHPPQVVRAEPVPVVERVEPVVTRDAAEPVVTRDTAEPVITRDAAQPVVTRDTAEPLVTRDAATPVVTQDVPVVPDEEPKPTGPRTFTSDAMRELSSRLAVGAEASLVGIADEVDLAKSTAELRETRELAGRMVTQWNEAAADKDAFADTLGRNLTPQEIALLPEGIRERVNDRAVLRRVRDVLAPALANGTRLPSPLSEPEVLTAEGHRAGAILEQFLARTPPEDRRRIAGMLTSPVRGGLGIDEQWQLPRELWRRLESEAAYMPTTPAGEPPRAISDPRAREVAARLAAGTPDARADVSQIVMRWYNDPFQRPNGDELADSLARNLMPAEIAQLPGEVRRRIADRGMLLALRDGLQANTEPAGMTPPDPTDTSQLAWNRRAAAIGLRRWLDETPSVDRQRIAYVLAREVTLREQWLLPRDLWREIETLAARR